MEDKLFLSRQDVKRILEELNFVPSRRLGQSFMTDQRALHRIVEALDLRPQDIILEIGPGLGALTGFLLEKVKRVIAVELDARLFRFLNERFKNKGKFFVLNEDILTLDLESVLRKQHDELQPSGSIKIAGNLPYRISTQILFKLLEGFRPERMVLAFQLEVADRLTASRGSKDYGAMTLIAQFYAEIKKIFRIPKECFYPQPEVDTGILFFRFRILDLGLESGQEKSLFTLIKLGFAQRRKTLKNALTNSHRLPYTEEDIEKALSHCNLDLKVRGEDLTLLDFAKLLKALGKHEKPNGY
jgi:16S rRNA (adenine1518-N6/adenine1519-N6)-dimethyltransferase